LPRPRVPRCSRGHDLRELGRDRTGHCRQCKLVDDRQRSRLRRARLRTGDAPAGLMAGEGWSVTSAGFAWSRTTIETHGRMVVVAKHLERTSEDPWIAGLAEHARVWLEKTGDRLGDRYVATFFDSSGRFPIEDTHVNRDPETGQIRLLRCDAEAVGIRDDLAEELFAKQWEADPATDSPEMAAYRGAVTPIDAARKSDQSEWNRRQRARLRLVRAMVEPSELVERFREADALVARHEEQEQLEQDADEAAYRLASATRRARAPSRRRRTARERTDRLARRAGPARP
jgi:hypothetical protein